MAKFDIDKVPWEELDEVNSVFPELIRALTDTTFFSKSGKAFERLGHIGLRNGVTPYIIGVMYSEIEKHGEVGKHWFYDFFYETRFSCGEGVSIYTGRETSLTEAQDAAHLEGAEILISDMSNPRGF